MGCVYNMQQQQQQQQQHNNNNNNNNNTTTTRKYYKIASLVCEKEFVVLNLFKGGTLTIFL